MIGLACGWPRSTTEPVDREHPRVKTLPERCLRAMSPWSQLLLAAISAVLIGCARGADPVLESQSVYGAVIDANAEPTALVRDTLFHPQEVDAQAWSSFNDTIPHLSRTAFDEFLSFSVEDGTWLTEELDDGPMPAPRGTDVAIALTEEIAPIPTLVFTRVGFDGLMRHAVVASHTLCVCNADTFECSSDGVPEVCGHFTLHGVRWRDGRWTQSGEADYYFAN